MQIAFGCMGYAAAESLTARALGKTELTVLPRDMFTELYAATATVWKVEVTASNV